MGDALALTMCFMHHFIVLLQEIMMDHSLRSISYIADIGDLLVIMARRRMLPNAAANAGAEGGASEVIGSTPKMICHVFESEEVCCPLLLVLGHFDLNTFCFLF